MLNRGVNGNEAGDMLARLESDVREGLVSRESAQTLSERNAK